MMNRQDLIRIFIDRQIKHIRLVQDYMIILELNRDKLPFEVKEFELLRSSMKHDLTKFQEGFISRYIDIAEYKESKKLGLSTDMFDKNTIYNVSEEYYKMEPHHMEYHHKNGTVPSNVDICEICCDVAANSDRNGEDDYTAWFLKEAVNNDVFIKNRQSDFLQILNLLMNNKQGIYDKTNLEPQNRHI